MRANASCRSHEELDNSTDLDAGDPAELADQHDLLVRRHPQITILGGCCGTDNRHVAAIARTHAPEAADAATDTATEAADAATDTAAEAADAATDTATESVDTGTEAAEETAAEAEASMSDKIAAALTPDGFNLDTVSELIAGSDLGEIKKIALTEGLKQAQENPELLQAALDAVKEALGL